MASTRTEISEIVTGLGCVGEDDLDVCLRQRPAALTNVPDEAWRRVVAAREEGRHSPVFAAAWENGWAFFAADDGLRGRPPIHVEWKGPDRVPASETLPADIRVDHVYLISCKYGSRVLHNTSPARVFEDRLRGEARAPGGAGSRRSLRTSARSSTTRSGDTSGRRPCPRSRRTSTGPTEPPSRRPAPERGRRRSPSRTVTSPARSRPARLQGGGSTSGTSERARSCSGGCSDSRSRPTSSSVRPGGRLCASAC